MRPVHVGENVPVTNDLGTHVITTFTVLVPGCEWDAESCVLLGPNGHEYGVVSAVLSHLIELPRQREIDGVIHARAVTDDELASEVAALTPDERARLAELARDEEQAREAMETGEESEERLREAQWEEHRAQEAVDEYDRRQAAR